MELCVKQELKPEELGTKWELFTINEKKDVHPSRIFDHHKMKKKCFDFERKERVMKEVFFTTTIEITDFNFFFIFSFYFLIIDETCGFF